MTNHLRPDEMVTESEIRKSQGRTNAIKSGLETIKSVASGGLGATAAAKVLPFLSEYIPEDLALKGITKVFPKLGAFLQNGISQGLSAKSGMDFIKEEITKQQPTKENRNIIEMESPELHQLIDQEIKKGKKPLEAATLATKGGKFSKIIAKLQKDHNVSWGDIVQSIYGKGNMAQNSQSPSQSIKIPEQGISVKDLLAQGNPLPQQRQQQAQTQQQPQAMSPAAQAVIQTMQNINKSLGG